MLYQSKKLTIIISNECEIEYRPFKFKKNIITMIKGGSGIGKTTLLKVLGLLSWNVTKDSEITVSINGEVQVISPNKWKKNQQLREKYFAYIFQDDHLIDAISVRENICFPAISSGKKITDTQKDLERYLEYEFLKPIKNRLDNSCSILSGGEKKKVALLRAILKDPLILIADEPWTNLGGNLEGGDVRAYLDFFIEHRKNRSTILATHDKEVINHYKRYKYVEAFELHEGSNNGSLRELKIEKQ